MTQNLDHPATNPKDLEGAALNHPAAHQKSGIWDSIKHGFGMGFGGALGWNLGQLAWRWMKKGLIALSVILAAHFANSPAPTHQDHLAMSVQQNQQHHQLNK